VAIDMKTLKSVTFGDPDTKITVKRSWLKEVHRLLEQAEQDRRDLEALKNQLDEPSKMEKIFGKTDAFDQYIKGKRGFFD
jgi:hypothetical protein